MSTFFRSKSLTFVVHNSAPIDAEVFDSVNDDNERFTKTSINQRQQRYRSPHNPYSHYLGHSK